MFNFVKFGCLSFVVCCLFSGCAVSQRTVQSPGNGCALSFETGGFIERYPWIRTEIRTFLAQEEVRSALGFDPLDYDQPILIHILEHRLSDRADLDVFGRTVNEYVSVSGHIFVGSGSQSLPGPALAGGPLCQKRAEMLSALTARPSLLILYRNLLVAHEVAHVAEWYALMQTGENVRLTGHGITNRVEVKILTHLYRSGKTDPETYVRMLHFYKKYLNEENQPSAEIHAFLAHNLIDPVFVSR